MLRYDSAEFTLRDPLGLDSFVASSFTHLMSALRVVLMHLRLITSNDSLEECQEDSAMEIMSSGKI